MEIIVTNPFYGKVVDLRPHITAEEELKNFCNAVLMILCE